VFYAVVFAEPFGLPLAGLGVLHLGLDVAVWTAALAPALKEVAGQQPGPPPRAARRLAAPQRTAP
jgi:hypothetical protein